MELIRINLDRTYNEIEELSITIGQFDGLHLAHIKIINETVEYANERKIKSAVFTFDPHPDYFLNKRKYNGYLTPNDLKIEKISKLGVDYMLIIPFNDFVSKMTPEEFINKVLKKFKIRKVFIGYDFTFGYLGKGNKELLKEFYSISVVDEIKFNNEKIGSTIIRKLLLDGNLDEVTKLLNGYYLMKGKVISGNHIGEKLGIRTANVDILEDYPIFKTGVYSVYVKVDKIRYLGVANFGYHPTIEKTVKPILEVHILDFQSEIYNKEIEVELVSFLREEKMFSNREELIKQIKEDIKNTKRRLKI